MNGKRLVPLATSLLVVVLAGCPAPQEEAPVEPMVEQPAAETAVEEATAVIQPTSGSTVTGTAVFTARDGKVVLDVRLENLAAGDHGAHIHEHGDCSSDDGVSAGGHWNPTGADHGKWGEAPFHLGDIGNVTAGEDGVAMLTLTTELWSIGTGEINDVVGKAIIVHEKADDFVTQPTGAAGARLACGVIESGI